MLTWNRAVRNFWKDEEGLGTLEVVLIIAVVIILALLFKDWIIDLLKNLMGSADEKANEIFDE
ncbi:Flp1 family type IVb pilin [Paenibacillus sacheonensis]|uniref:Flp1 family type IVb pilin n=1 Tax=Paenibacillus sacheonensis TaxID=742054 RepID=UPI00147857AF|nr:Flp1 family type IVb pilin [Paenibacillus sacheonensis]MBM7566940.1 Flp pilus assembly pilin Flp [Paenibacillus sacheonensis]